MLRWLAASLILVAVAIAAYVLGTFYPNSRVQQAQVATAQITPMPQETSVPQVDPQQAMAFALMQAGIDTTSPGDQ